jgi:hypothetical protein
MHTPKILGFKVWIENEEQVIGYNKAVDQVNAKIDKLVGGTK